VAATDDLSAELIKFNAFLASEEDQERQARAVKKALRLREEAAAALKKVNGDPKASKEDKEAAEVAWKAAIATEERVKAGGPLVEPGTDSKTPAEEAPGDAAPTDEASGDAAPTDEASGDEASGDEAPAPDEEPPAASEASADAAPTDETPADEAPAPDEEAPGEGAPATEAAPPAPTDEGATPEAPADEAAEAAPTGDAATEAPAEDAPVHHEPPVDEPPIELVDDVRVVTDADRAEPHEPEHVVVGDVEDDDVPPPDQTEYPEAGSDAPAAG
jgi:hypothetical protein